jgi:hypothetical protein
MIKRTHTSKPTIDFGCLSTNLFIFSMSIAIPPKISRNAPSIMPHSLLSCKEMNLLTESLAFSIQDHHSRIFAFNIPLLLILWHISSRARGAGIEPYPISKNLSVRALFVFLAFAGLLAIAISLTILATCAGNAQTLPLPAAPETVWGFFALFLSCLSTASNYANRERC